MILDMLTVAGAKKLMPAHQVQTGLFYSMGAVFNHDEFLPAASQREAMERAQTGYRKMTYFGFEPAKGGAVQNQTGFRGWSQPVANIGAEGGAFKSNKVLGSVLGPAASMYFLYDGYQQNGLRGAFEAGVFDIAASTMIAKYQFGTVATSQLMTDPDSGKLIKKFGTKYISKFGTGTALGIGIIGHMGWEYGKENFGIAGGLAGLAGMSKLAHVGMTGGVKGFGKAAVIGMGLAGAKYLQGQVKKTLQQQQEKFEMGRAITKSKVGIDTAGSTAAFYTRNANTMRARSVMAMRNSHLNARSALGMEAAYTHMDRNYFSRYR